MSDDRIRVTMRLHEETYDRLCAELESFSTDTSRMQYLAQFYLDAKHGLSLPQTDGETDDDQSTQSRHGRVQS